MDRFFHIDIEPSAGAAPVLQVIDQANSQIELNAYFIDSPSVLEALRQAVQRAACA